MKTNIHFAAAASLAIALNTFVSAAPVGAAVGVGSQVGVGVGLGAPGGSVGGAGAIRGGAGAGIGAPGGSSVSGMGSFDAGESIGMRQERMRAEQEAHNAVGVPHSGAADSHASVMGETRGISVATLAASGASASLNTAETVHTIQAGAMAQREQLLDELHARVEASAKAMGSVRKSGAKLDGDAKAEFKAADADVKAKEKALKKSMKAAEKASADAWTDSRAKLAADYDAYASAVAKAEVASQANANAKAKSTTTEKPDKN